MLDKYAEEKKFELTEENGFDGLGRPLWDYYFISMAFLIAQRSLDESTKYGAIVVSNDNTILSIGYNGPPRGCNDRNVPQNRPEKYLWFLHAEEAAIVNAARNGACLKESIFYITGAPCARCVRKMINVGVKKIIYGGVNSKCLCDDDRIAIEQMMRGKDIEVIKIEEKDSLINIMKNTIDYIEKKS